MKLIDKSRTTTLVAGIALTIAGIYASLFSQRHRPETRFALGTSPVVAAVEGAAAAGGRRRRLSWLCQESNDGRRSQAKRSQRQVNTKGNTNLERNSNQVKKRYTEILFGTFAHIRSPHTQKLTDPRKELNPYQKNQ